jgi:hypothetical protein
MALDHLPETGWFSNIATVAELVSPDLRAPELAPWPAWVS